MSVRTIAAPWAPVRRARARAATRRPYPAGFVAMPGQAQSGRCRPRHSRAGTPRGAARLLRAAQAAVRRAHRPPRPPFLLRFNFLDCTLGFVLELIGAPSRRLTA